LPAFGKAVLIKLFLKVYMAKQNSDERKFYRQFTSLDDIVDLKIKHILLWFRPETVTTDHIRFAHHLYKIGAVPRFIDRESSPNIPTTIVLFWHCVVNLYEMDKIWQGVSSYNSTELRKICNLYLVNGISIKNLNKFLQFVNSPFVLSDDQEKNACQNPQCVTLCLEKKITNRGILLGRDHLDYNRAPWHDHPSNKMVAFNDFIDVLDKKKYEGLPPFKLKQANMAIFVHSRQYYSATVPPPLIPLSDAEDDD